MFACHLDFHQAQDVILGHFAHHLGVERGEPLVDVGTGGVHVFGLLEAAVFVDALFDEDFLQRGEVQGLQGLVALYFQFRGCGRPTCGAPCLPRGNAASCPR